MEKKRFEKWNTSNLHCTNMNKYACKQKALSRRKLENFFLANSKKKFLFSLASSRHPKGSGDFNVVDTTWSHSCSYFFSFLLLLAFVETGLPGKEFFLRLKKKVKNKFKWNISNSIMIWWRQDSPRPWLLILEIPITIGIVWNLIASKRKCLVFAFLVSKVDC